MNFYGYFDNLEGKHFGLEIVTPAQGDTVDLLMGDTPCKLSVSSSNLFQPVKSRSLSIEIVSKDWYFDLYEPTSRGTTVKLYDYTYQDGYEGDVNHITVGKVYFRGYLTPCSYKQDFTYLDTIKLEAVDGVSTCKDFKWVDNGKYNTMLDIIINILKSAGYKDNLYVPQSFTHINGQSITNTVLDKLYVLSTNFLDDNEERTPWTEYEVLEEICKYLGMSLCPDGDNVWLVDYRAENAGSLDYSVWNIQTGVQQADYQSDETPSDIVVDNMAPGTSKIDIDDIYNKIEVSDNLYKIDEITPDIFDDKLHISVTEEENLGADKSKWSTVRRKQFLWWEWDDKKEYLEGTDYQTLCRIDPKSNWKHNYYKMSNGLYLGCSDPNSDTYLEKGYYDEDTAAMSTQQSWTGSKTIQKVNTQCCLLQHYAFIDESHKYNVPASIDWTDILTFFNNGPTKLPFDIGDIEEKYIKPVLEYNVNEEIQWRPTTGISWITIKGSLFYQGKCQYKDGKKTKVLTLINTKEGWYSTTPIDKSMDSVPDDITVAGTGFLAQRRSPSDPLYGKGFGLWKMRIQIGDEETGYKYWKDYYDYNQKKYISGWVSTPSDFWIRYNNNPDNNNDEFIEAFKWIDTVNNTTYKDKVGEDAYAIPIPSVDEVNKDTTGQYSGWDIPSRGKMKITIYNPTEVTQEIVPLIKSIFPSFISGWTESCVPVVYCKDFEIGYVYTDSSVWWNNHSDSDDKDKVYIGYIDDTYVNDFDGITCKINTALKDKPISRSFVATETGYLDTLRHKCADAQHGDVDKQQEYNIVDMYLDHNSERKVIYTRNMKGYYQPNSKFYKPGNSDNEGEIEGTFMIDSQSYDFRENNNKIKFIAF